MTIQWLGKTSFKIKDLIVKDNFMGPGEYEKGGVFIKGLKYNKTVFYTIEMEDIKILYIADATKALDEKLIDELGEIDVLLISLDEEAQHIINEIEPKIFIPMNYTKLDEKTAKNFGLKNVQNLDKLTLKKKDLTDEMKGIILNQT